MFSRYGVLRGTLYLSIRTVCSNAAFFVQVRFFILVLVSRELLLLTWSYEILKTWHLFCSQVAQCTLSSNFYYVSQRTYVQHSVLAVTILFYS